MSGGYVLASTIELAFKEPRSFARSCVLASMSGTSLVTLALQRYRIATRISEDVRRASYQISSLYNLPTVEPDISLLPSRRICDSSKEHSAVTPSEEVCGSISTRHHLEHAAPKRYSKHSGRILRTLLYNLKSGMRGRQVG